MLPRVDICIVTIACAVNGRILGWLHRSHERTVVFVFAAFQFITVFVPINLVRYQLSWVFQLGGGINAFLWNSYGLLVSFRYAIFQSVISSLLTVITLLLGSGVLRDAANTSGATYDISTAT